MNKFKVGDRLTSHKPNGYSHTGEKCECVVTEVVAEDYIQVRVVKPGVRGQTSAIGMHFFVNPHKLVLLRPRMEENE